jgi:hypothetical protein
MIKVFPIEAKNIMSKVREYKLENIPAVVFQAFNNMIVSHYNTNSETSTFSINDVKAEICKQYDANYNMFQLPNIASTDIRKHIASQWFDIEDVYAGVGWDVTYDDENDFFEFKHKD